MSYEAFSGLGNRHRTNGQFAFAQVACTQSDDQLDHKIAGGLLTACIGMAMVLIFVMSMSYFFAESSIDEQLVNLELLSIRDFCVQGDVPRQLYDMIRARSGEHDINGLKKYLRKEIRKTLH